MSGMPYNPWNDLKARFPHIQVDAAHQLPHRIAGGIIGNTIYLCRTLTHAAKRCTLAHEIVHLERGTGHFGQPFEDYEERIVDRIAARRLITPERFIEAAKWTRQIGRECADELVVDLHTLNVWIRSLSCEERTSIWGELSYRSAA